MNLRVTYYLSEESIAKLGFLAVKDSRSKSNMLDKLIREAYDKEKHEVPPTNFKHVDGPLSPDPTK